MASPNTLKFRTPPKRMVTVFVCKFCWRRDKEKARVGGTLQRSRVDGRLYHPEHLPERHPQSQM